MSATVCFPAGAIPDAVLVDTASRGDRDAFAELYRRYARMVHGILLARVPPEDAADLTQDVFLAAMRQLPYLRNGDAFGAWLAAIARRKAADFRRSQRPQEELTQAAAPGPSAEDRTDAHRVLALIRTLPEAYRETLVLRFVEGFTGPEIAERTGLTPDSVRVNLSRGMKLLREKLERSAVR